MVRISIIIPAYNAEKHIEECLDSIQIEKYDDVEIILIDDGSMDKTSEICSKIAEENSNIHLIRQKNMGVSAARNKGIDFAHGEYVMFVDADDVMSENWYEEIKDVNGEDFYFITKKIGDLDKNKLFKEIIELSSTNAGIAAPFSKLYRREFLNKNKIRFREGIIHGEDLLFNLEVVLNSKRIKLKNTSFYNYRVTPSSSSKRFDEKIFESDSIFQSKVSEVLEKSSLAESEIEHLKLLLAQGACLTFAQKIASIKGFEKAKKYYAIYEKEPYSTALNSKYVTRPKFHFFLKMLLRKRYYICYLGFRMVSKVLIEREHFLEA